MTYTPEERVKNSDRCLQILKNLREKNEGYSKDIAKDIGATKESVTGFLKILRDTNLIERGRRTQRQYYETTVKGENFLRMVEEHKTLNEKIEDFFNEKYKMEELAEEKKEVYK